VPHVTVSPEAFRLVAFDAERIRAAATELAGAIGLPDGLELHVAVDEETPFGQTWTVIDWPRVELRIDGGAFEDPKEIRRLSEAGTRQVLGRLLYRVLDRLDPGFGSPPPDPELGLAEHAAWDAYAVGRYARLDGVDVGQTRRRYAFRLRHGFTDAADRAFDRLWFGSGLTWADLEAVCRETSAAR
jgi:hypothetical protein